MLVLPVGAHRHDTIARDRFQEWIRAHINTWFAFTRKLQLGIAKEDIILVTGFHRTRSWFNVTFNELKGIGEFSLGFEISGPVGADVQWQILTPPTPVGVYNQGPSGVVRGTQIVRADGY